MCHLAAMYVLVDAYIYRKALAVLLQAIAPPAPTPSEVVLRLRVVIFSHTRSENYAQNRYKARMIVKMKCSFNATAYLLESFWVPLYDTSDRCHTQSLLADLMSEASTE